MPASRKIPARAALELAVKRHDQREQHASLTWLAGFETHTVDIAAVITRARQGGPAQQ